MFVFGFPMTSVVIDVQVQARGRERRVPEIVSDQSQIDLLIGHVRARSVPQPMRRRLLEHVGSMDRRRVSFAQSRGSACEYPFDDGVQRGARERRTGFGAAV